MGDISTKIQKFIEIFIDNNGYVKVVEGLKNTVIIAIAGLIIGIIIGTLIATVRVIPKYKRLPRVLDAICSVYVGFFRGTPMVVQLLLFYYVLLPIVGGHMTGVQVAMLVFGLNSGAYISEIMRGGPLIQVRWKVDVPWDSVFRLPCSKSLYLRQSRIFCQPLEMNLFL